MPATSRPARLTSTRTNRLLSHPQKNTEACDELRRQIQMQASPALIESLATTAEVSLNSSAGRLAEVVALASADGHVDQDEARQIEVECCRQCETAGRVAEQARRMAS